MLMMEDRKAVCARLSRMAFEQVQNDFTRKFRKPSPTRLAIENPVNKFKRTGSDKDEEYAGRPSITSESSQNLQGAILNSPYIFTRIVSGEFGVPQPGKPYFTS
ncbi:hypothetical protein AVEN_212433-1 [Araneus ventricosus]|uniref:DUF4817 domain-containing protein n=1 Tax=Araneus ventricosus TaxID=182803 RepID=A0A4Y2VT92_ARAVE|nr:hypothetical protein AVEN_212433-1 [Araneus ventricosus]